MVPTLERHTIEAMIWRPGADQAGLAITEPALKTAISSFRNKLPSPVRVDFLPDSKIIGVVTELWFDEQVKAMMCKVELTDDSGIKWINYDVQGSLRPSFFIDTKYTSKNTGFEVVTQLRVAEVSMCVLGPPARFPDPYRLYA